MGSKGYWSLLLSLLNKRKYKWHYSPPQLVNGGLAPPPSKFYPGTTCYMVALTVNNVEYYGFGPTPSIAKHFAVFEAYNSLHPLPSEEVERFRNTIPLDIIESPENSDTDQEQTDPLSSNQSDQLPSDHLQSLAIGVSSNHGDGSTSETGSVKERFVHQESSLSQLSDSMTGDVDHEELKETSQPSQQETTTRECAVYQNGENNSSCSSLHAIENICESFSDPVDHCEVENRTQPLLVTYETKPEVWIHDERVCKKRDVCIDLDEMARRKGVSVSFKVKIRGPPNSQVVRKKEREGERGGGKGCWC